MKGKILLIVLINFVVNMGTDAQNIRKMWLEMPDSLAPYLKQQQRSMLLDYYEMGGEKEIKNDFDGISRLDTLANDFLSVRLNNALSLQIGLLPTQEGDTLACVIKTYYSPAEESQVALYTRSWELVNNVSINTDSLYHRPDTMSIEKYEKLKGLLQPELTVSTYSPINRMLTFWLSIPFNYSEEKDALETILLQRNLKWDGKTFKECYNKKENT